MPYEFDLEKYLRASRKVPIDDLPWDQVQDHPLTVAEVRFLRYMMNIEHHTILYLKELLSTDVIHDADVTGFLCCWNYEEYFHGAALEKFLLTYAGKQAATHGAKDRLSNGSRFGRALKKTLGPVITAATPDFAATHMTWGATQELTTLHAYEAVARQSQHPMLKELMARIIRDERRHFAFYYNQAEKRLTDTPRMRRITRLAMDKLWQPVGVGTMPSKESDFTSWYLFRDAEGQAAVKAVEEGIRQLPGMDGWDNLSRKTTAAIARAAASDPDVEAWSKQVAPRAAKPLVVAA